VLDHFRREKSSRQVNESEAGYDMLGTMRFSEPTAEDNIVLGEIEQTMRQLVDELPDEQQEVVRLRYYSKLSFQEIAEQTEVSINTALGRMRYALINLRRLIKEKNIVLS
jgi:RNA polymerase sigma-70 factor (ECF subfamily)